MDDFCYSRVVCCVYDIPADICPCRAAARLFDGILWDITAIVSQHSLLVYHRRYPRHVSNTRLCLEIVPLLFLHSRFRLASH